MRTIDVREKEKEVQTEDIQVVFGKEGEYLRKKKGSDLIEVEEGHGGDSIGIYVEDIDHLIRALETLKSILQEDDDAEFDI